VGFTQDLPGYRNDILVATLPFRGFSVRSKRDCIFLERFLFKMVRTVLGISEFENYRNRQKSRWTPEVMDEDLNFSNKKENCTRVFLITTDKIPASFLFFSRTIKSLIGDLSTEFTDLSTVFRCLSLILSELYRFRWSYNSKRKKEEKNINKTVCNKNMKVMNRLTVYFEVRKFSVLICKLRFATLD